MYIFYIDGVKHIVYINDAHITYKMMPAIHDYKSDTHDYKKDYITQFNSLADSASERITREKVIDPLFMGLGDYDVKSDGSKELHSYDVKSDGSKELHLDYVKFAGSKVYLDNKEFDGSKELHLYNLYYLYYCQCDECNKRWKREEVFSTDPFFSMLDFQKLYGLSYSPIPDLVIKNGSKLVIVEAKKKGINLKASEYKGDGAKQLLGMSKERKILANELSAISEGCQFRKAEYKSGELLPLNPDTMPNVASIVPTWSSDPSDPSYDAGTKFTLTFTSQNEPPVELYQLDWYLFDLFYKADVRSVVLTNGELARRFYKEDDQIKSKDYNLTDESEFNKFRDDVIKTDLA